MLQIKTITKSLLGLVIIGISLSSCRPKAIKMDDSEIVQDLSHAPLCLKIEMNNKQRIAAKEGRLELQDPISKNSIPFQLESSDEEASTRVVLIVPENGAALNEFRLMERKSPIIASMKASVDSNSGQIIVWEDEDKVLQYNYQTVYENDVVRPGNIKDKELIFSTMSGVYYEEYLKAHPELKRNDTTTSSIYAVPRSDYIHPLYGLEGEMLTSDWPDGGHPHHRGIFWAWPEVKYGDQLGDIYALQRVFARPTGNVSYTNGPVYAEVDAENLWMWEEEVAIVRENTVIRVYRSTPKSRIIDLTIKLLALKDSVTIATRFTNSYGGLNIRMQTPEEQNISYFTDEVDSLPLRAWSDFNGIFKGNTSKSGLMVLQHQENPEYPGAWRDYPDLAWVQPTFPSPETRYFLNKNKALELRYRLVIHTGGKLTKNEFIKSWDAYHVN